ncbi:hypothetical protein [Bacillus cereus group sp. BfR-BA-01380]|uniref:hypothetical protein n=1 Tax=Bacillus cereus group sp. BfR-BA-01380 TaxID=2920324 RepID=UPI001F5A1925
MEVLINHIKGTHPSCHHIRLTVHSENDAGKKIYTGLGFTDDYILTYDELTYSLYI